MATADELLGPPKAEDLLGPAPAAVVQPSSTAQDEAVSRTGIGRILDAFGQGAKDGWGAGDLGFEQGSEATQFMRRQGVFRSGKNLSEMDFVEGLQEPIKGFNEALIRPIAAGLDALSRGVNAIVYSAGYGIGQTAQELGESQGMSRRLTRDVIGLADAAQYVMGIEPAAPGLALGKARRAGMSAEERAYEKAATGARSAGERKGLGGPGGAATAEEDLSNIPETPLVDKAGNINLQKYNGDEDLKHVLRRVAEANDDFLVARRAPQTWEDTEKLAESLGMNGNEFMQSRKGTALLAHEIRAAQKWVDQSTADVKELALKVVGGSDQDILNFQLAQTRQMATMEFLSGAVAESGRTQNILKKAWGSLREGREVQGLIEEFGGRNQTEIMAKMINTLDSAGHVNRFLQDAKKATLADQIVEAWRAGLFSGLVTQARNLLSNTAIALYRIPETYSSALASQIRRGERIYYTEAGDRAFAILHSLPEGMKLAWKSWKSEIPDEGLMKIDSRHYRTIPSKELNIPLKEITLKGKKYRVPFTGPNVEIGGKQVRIPFRMLTATDSVYRTIAKSQEIYARARRISINEGLKGSAQQQRMQEIIQKVSNAESAFRNGEKVDAQTRKILEAAKFNGDYQVLTKALGVTGQAAQRWVNSHPLFKFLVPTLKFPVNAVKFVGERTLLAVFSKEVRAVLKGRDGDIAAAEQWGRLVLGSIVTGTAFKLAAEGHISGYGPTDPAERAVWYLAGNQPYSVRIGETWYSYSGIEPFATMFGWTADAYNAGVTIKEKEADELVGLITASISQNLVNKTWLQGPAEALDAIQDPDRYGGRYVRKMFGTAIPNISAQFARSQDPYIRKIDTMLDEFKSRVPGQSTKLMPRRDVFGEPIKREGAAGPDVISPIFQSTVRNDPVVQELIRLRVFPAKVRRQIKGVDLTPQQYDDYARISGRLLRFSLNKVMQSPGWQYIPDAQKIDIVTKQVEKTRQSASTFVIMQSVNKDDDLLDQILKLKAKDAGVEVERTRTSPVPVAK